MRLILKTNTTDTYYIHLPNHIDVNNVDQLIEDAKYELPVGVEILAHQLHSDSETDIERKQLDMYGFIKYPLIKLNMSVFAK